MYLNCKEKSTISQFIQNLDTYENETMTLIWNDGSKITASFDTCFEDESDCNTDDENYEEFISFAFTVLDYEGNPPVYITEDDCFLVSYHNFPDIVLSENGEKIN